MPKYSKVRERVSVKEAAEMLCVSRTLMYRWISKGLIPTHLFLDKTCIYVEDVKKPECEKPPGRKKGIKEKVKRERPKLPKGYKKKQGCTTGLYLDTFVARQLRLNEDRSTKMTDQELADLIKGEYRYNQQLYVAIGKNYRKVMNDFRYLYNAGRLKDIPIPKVMSFPYDKKGHPTDGSGKLLTGEQIKNRIAKHKKRIFNHAKSEVTRPKMGSV